MHTFSKMSTNFSSRSSAKTSRVSVGFPGAGQHQYFVRYLRKASGMPQGES